jgi:hypothetical protein
VPIGAWPAAQDDKETMRTANDARRKRARSIMRGPCVARPRCDALPTIRLARSRRWPSQPRVRPGSFTVPARSGSHGARLERVKLMSTTECDFPKDMVERCLGPCPTWGAG